MTVTVLAEVNVAYFLGELIAMSPVPLAGAAALYFGLRQRSRARHPADDTVPTQPAWWVTALIIGGALVLAAGLLHITGRAIDLIPRKSVGEPSVHPGQCISQSSFSPRDTAPTAQDCDAADSTLEVVTAGGGSAACPDGKLKDSAYLVAFDTKTTLCYLFNLRQGGCYAVTGLGESPMLEPSSCDGDGSIVRVVRRIDGSYDRSLCPVETRAIFYIRPARLYCLQSVSS